MESPAQRRRSSFIGAVLGAMTTALPVSAQVVGADDAKVAAAAEKWIASDQVDTELLEATVKVMSAQPKLAVDWLAQQFDRAANNGQMRNKGVQALCTQFAIDYLRVQRATNLVYVGQYDLLLRLQPYVGDLFFELLLDTPAWYPLTFRAQLVAPLRDLQVRPPSAERLDGIVKLAEDADESEGLRRALAAALWQWGTKHCAEAVINKLQQDIANGDAEDRVNSTLHLADFYVLLRDYKLAASAHRSAQVLAKQGNLPLLPIAWYAAACVHALLGDVERGFQALDECTRQLASKDLDESLRLELSMFANDPELALLRKEPRFAEMVARVPPTDPKGADKRTDNSAGR